MRGIAPTGTRCRMLRLRAPNGKLRLRAPDAGALRLRAPNAGVLRLRSPPKSGCCAYGHPEFAPTGIQCRPDRHLISISDRFGPTGACTQSINCSTKCLPPIAKQFMDNTRVRRAKYGCRIAHHGTSNLLLSYRDTSRGMAQSLRRGPRRELPSR
jgi:hypothetical protein